jgi:hypothetical protein
MLTQSADADGAAGACSPSKRGIGRPMNLILPYPLWVGHSGDERDFPKVLELGIRALVQIAVEEPPLHPPREFIYLRFPLVDGAGNPADLLSLSVHTVAHLLRSGVPTLVCCGAGLSRAPTIAAAALSLAYHEPPERCLERVVGQHRCDVSPGLWAEVLRVLPSRH